MYLLLIHCWEIEQDRLAQVEQAVEDKNYHFTGHITQPPWIEMHRYVLMKCAMGIGNFIFMAYVQ